jgi:hypothetical protein
MPHQKAIIIIPAFREAANQIFKHCWTIRNDCQFQSHETEGGFQILLILINHLYNYQIAEKPWVFDKNLLIFKKCFLSLILYGSNNHFC